MNSCVICTVPLKTTNRTRRTMKYCLDCKVTTLKKQKRDWSRKKIGKLGKKRVCHFCKIMIDDNADLKRIYCVDCAVLRGKILHHISYKKRLRLSVTDGKVGASTLATRLNGVRHA